MVLEALKEKRRRQDGGGSGAAIKLTLGKKKRISGDQWNQCLFGC